MNEEEDTDLLEDVEMMSPLSRALAPISIPNELPEVPLLTVSRNPLFPRFVKMLEVSSKYIHKNNKSYFLFTIEYICNFSTYAVIKLIYSTCY